jgi:hypothetical protein
MNFQFQTSITFLLVYQPQIYLLTENPFVDIWYGLPVKRMSRVVAIKKIVIRKLSGFSYYKICWSNSLFTVFLDFNCKKYIFHQFSVYKQKKIQHVSQTNPSTRPGPKLLGLVPIWQSFYPKFQEQGGF